LAPLSVEEFWALGLDVRHRVQSEHCLARGSLTGVEIHPRDVFRPLIRRGTAAVIFCHNHPSGVMCTSALCGGPTVPPTDRWLKMAT
jgi:DNA repair protein RadC